MKIEKIYIHRFAGISEKQLDFSDGINIVEGPNESGKSTISDFIKFMLYGLSGKDEKKRVFGWSAGADKISGNMIVRCGKDCYRIERVMGESGRGSCKIVELAGNTVVHEGKNPGELFLGVSSDVFERTAFVGQRGGSRIDGGELSAGIENILFSADENVNTQKALKRLDDARISLLYKNRHGGKIYDLKKELEELEQRLERAVSINGNIIIKEGSVRDIEQKSSENAKRIETLEKDMDYYETGRLKRQYDKVVEYKKALEAERAMLDSYEEKYIRNNFFPDTAYFSELDKLEEELRFSERNIKMLEEELDGVRKNLEGDSAGKERITAVQKDEIITEAAQRSLKRKSYIFIGAVFGILASIVGVGLAVLIMLHSGLSVFCGILCAILTFCAILSFVASARQATAVREILQQYGAESRDELENILDSMIVESNISVRNEELLSELEQKHRVAEAQIMELDKQLKSVLTRWNMGNIAEARKYYSEYMEEGNGIRRRIENLENLYTAAADNFKGVNIPELREKFAKYSETTPLEEMNYDAMKRELDFLQNAQRVLYEKKHEDEKLLAGYYTQAEQPSKLYDKIAELKSAIGKYERKHDALLLAYEKLTEAGVHMKENIAPRLSEYAGRILESVSGEKYHTLGVGHELELSYTAADGKGDFEQTHEIEFMSMGTQDIAYISLRFALIKLLYGKETPPVVFDDSFTRLDDMRLENMLRLTAKTSVDEDMQMLIFSCHKRDSEIMKRIGVFNRIEIG